MIQEKHKTLVIEDVGWGSSLYTKNGSHFVATLNFIEDCEEDDEEFEDFAKDRDTGLPGRWYFSIRVPKHITGKSEDVSYLQYGHRKEALKVKMLSLLKEEGFDARYFF